MPPASPDTTLAWRSASSSDVLPWSTWPITVTTGERGSVSVESSTTSNRPSSTSDAATRLTVWPSSSAISCAVSASITSVILCIAPCFISSRITSTARSDMRLASSWMLMASGMIDLANQLFLRLVRRMSLQALGAAAERGDRTLAHVVGIERGDQRQAAALLLRRRLGGGLGRRHRTDDAAGAAADLARTFVLVADVGGDARRACGRAARRAVAAAARGLGFAETLLGFEFGLALGFLVLPVALFFGLAAGFGGFALGLLDAFLAVAALGFLFRQTPLFDRRGPWRRRVRWRARCVHPRSACAAPRRNCCAAQPARRRDGRAGAWRAGPWPPSARRARSFRCRCVAADTALAALLDHHLLGPAMAEALAHGARLDARLQRQGLARDTQCLVARRFRINHSAVLISLRRA